MNRNGLILLAIVLLLVGVFFWVLSHGGEKQYDWDLTYDNTSNQPYGTQLLFNILKSEYPGNFTEVRKPLRENPALLENKDNALYFLVGGSVYLDSASQENILKFVAEGNTACFITQNLPYEIFRKFFEGKFKLDSLNQYEYYDQSYVFQDSIARLSLLHPNLNTENYLLDISMIYNWEKVPANWNYFFSRTENIRFDSVVQLGAANSDYINFIRIHHGKGFIYLHSTPLAFTNFFLREKSGFDYLKKMFEHFHPNYVIWDEASKLYYYDDKSKPYAGQSPLKFILDNRSLRWAWYLLLVMALLFILFKAKRLQKIIPVHEPNLNTSLEFVQTVGRLYFLQNDHLALARQKMKLFLLFVRNKYKISLKNFDEPELKKLSIKSQITFDQLKRIFTSYKIVQKQTSISAQELIEFHKIIDHFYKNCK
ncbi:MAG TPA: hypothetical protein DCQ93_01425 [Bacteroidetes bacterium]|nr:hypothetical protein [Bacteroidota bacterium]